MLVAVAVAALALATAGGLQRVRVDTTVASFLPAGDGTVRSMQREQATFGADPIAVILTTATPAALLSGSALRTEIALEDTLSRLPGVAVVYGPGTTLNELSRSLQGVLVDISATRDALMAQAAGAAKAAGASAAAQSAAGEAAVSAFDARYARLLAAGLSVGLPSVDNAHLGSALFLQADGRGQPAFRWLVPDANHESILIRPVAGLDQARTQRLVGSVRRAVRDAKLPLSGSVVTGSPVLVAALAAEVGSELPLLAGCSLLAVAIGFACTRRRRPLWERLLPLGTGLAATAVTVAGFGWAGVPLSLGLLAFLPIILGVGTDYPIYALRRGRPRLVLSVAAASAASLATLAVDPLPYVRDLGLALAAGLLASALLGVVVARVAGPATPLDPPAGERRPLPGRAATPGRRGLPAALAAGVVLSIVGWAGMGSLGLDTDLAHLAGGLPALSQGLAAQQVLGASGELDVFVQAPDVLSPAMLSWWTRAEDRLVLDHGDQLRPLVSPASLLAWLGPTPSPQQVDAATSVLPASLTAASIRDDRRQGVMAFGVPLGTFGSDARLLAAVRRDLPPLPAGATVSVTGLPAVAARSYTLLSGGRVLPNAAGIGAFGLALVVLLRDRRSAALAVLAAGLAAGWGFAVLRLTGTALTPLTVSLGSLTSAVGGEFTVMAVARARAGALRPWSAVAAVAATSVVGFATLGLSRLGVMRQFGLVLAGSVGLALLAARLVVGADQVWQQRRAGSATPPAGMPVGQRQEVLV